MLTFVFSDMGTPANYRQMDGFGVHAFKWVNAKGEAVYVKYKWTSMQGHKNLSADETKKVVTEDWGNATSDLYANITQGNNPSWELSVQMIKPEDLDKFDFNPLDATKIWSETIAPSVKIGKMTLNKVPDNFFEESEQSAFAPANLVPGIEASEDRLLQGRLFSYLDTQRYRLGANFTKIDINRPKNTVTNYSQDGALRNTKQNGDINFQPSRTNGVAENTANKAYQLKINGLVQQARIKKENNFAQAGELYLSFSEPMRANLIKNLAGDLNQVKNKMIKAKMVGHFYMANQEFGMRLAQATGVTREDTEKAMKMQ
jgi:catalase